MTEKQISIIKRHIKEQPKMNNSELARHMFDHCTLSLSIGSLQNYIGKVKKMSPKTVCTTKEHLMDEKFPVEPEMCYEPAKVELKEAELPVHYDVLVLGVNSGVEYLDEYFDDAAKEARKYVIEFGNDARVTLNEKNSDESFRYYVGPEASSVGGLGEDNAICDGIQLALTTLMNEIEDCEGTDVNITIITNGPEWGSRTTTISDTSDYINKFSRAFGWCINLVFIGEEHDANNLARSLSIDTSNTLYSEDTMEIYEALEDARKTRTELLKAGLSLSYGTFR